MARVDAATQGAPVALVTGANKGIGFEIAKQLGGRGFTVVIGARDEHRGEAVAASLREDDILRLS